MEDLICHGKEVDDNHLRIICKKFELEGVLRVWFTRFTEKEVNFLLRFSSLVGKGEVV